MGNDGGSIPTRRELVKEAARNPSTSELKAAQQEQEEHLWTTDPISNKPLERPIVSDSSGKLYNKDSILEFLIPSDDPTQVTKKAEAERILQGAVKGLRDVVEIKFEVDPEAKIQDGRREVFVCPITNKTLGPGTKAVYLVPCGHAFAREVIKEVADEKCLQCNESYAPNDVIPIIPTSEEDIARLLLRVKTLKDKGLTHSLKKAPGSKKRKKNAESDGATADEKTTTSKDSSAKASPAPAAAPKTSDGIKNSATASLTAKVLAEQEERNKRRKMEKNENLNSLFSSRDQSKLKAKNNDFMQRGYTIPSNARR